jgi:hypothetical protein
VTKTAKHSRLTNGEVEIITPKEFATETANNDYLHRCSAFVPADGSAAEHASSPPQATAGGTLPGSAASQPH